jgi:transposase
METGSTISDLKLLVSQLLHRIDVLEDRVQELETENEVLRGRLGLHSKNSHKPPSSEGYGKKPAISQTKGGKQGGQIGHEGKSLEMVSQPDELVIHHVESCRCCGRKISMEDVKRILYRRQEFDIPLPKLRVIEHRLGEIRCCNEIQLGIFPSNIKGAVQYGTRIKALSVLLNTEYRMPFEKINQLFGDLWETSFNESTATSANEEVYDSLEVVENAIKSGILCSKVAHFDESGMRVEGKLHWFHVACTSMLCYLYVHANRGKKALEDTQSVLKDFTNWAIHDCWSSYFDYHDCQHALCNAHLLRELTALKEKDSLWANQMHDLLMDLYKTTKKGTEILKNKTEWLQKYNFILQQADKEEPPPIKNKRGKPTNSKGRNLMNRLVIHQTAVLAFAFDVNIPFTNNQAERDIRHVKVKQKVAMSFRTFKGAQIYARIQGFVTTTKKQGQNTFNQLCNIINGGEYTFSTIPK